MSGSENDNHPADDYAYQSSLDILRKICGDKWKFLIICNLFNGPKRFGELLYFVDSVTKKVLTENLRELERYGFVERTTYPGNVRKVEYRLTAIAQELKPIFQSLISWSLEYSRQQKTDSSLF